jgi:hypothetical protein
MCVGESREYPTFQPQRIALGQSCVGSVNAGEPESACVCVVCVVPPTPIKHPNTQTHTPRGADRPRREAPRLQRALPEATLPRQNLGASRLGQSMLASRKACVRACVCVLNQTHNPTALTGPDARRRGKSVRRRKSSTATFLPRRIASGRSMPASRKACVCRLCAPPNQLNTPTHPQTHKNK